MSHIKEVNNAQYEEGIKPNSVASEINWYALVMYQDGTVKYFVFDEPYNVKVSDFFDMTNKDNPVASIMMR